MARLQRAISGDVLHRTHRAALGAPSAVKWLSDAGITTSHAFGIVLSAVAALLLGGVALGPERVKRGWALARGQESAPAPPTSTPPPQGVYTRPPLVERLTTELSDSTQSTGSVDGTTAGPMDRQRAIKRGKDLLREIEDEQITRLAQLLGTRRAACFFAIELPRWRDGPPQRTAAPRRSLRPPMGGRPRWTTRNSSPTSKR